MIVVHDGPSMAMLQIGPRLLRVQELIDGQWVQASDETHHLIALDVTAQSQTFEQWWATKVAAGYQYGSDALEGVRFGFSGARGEA